MRQNGNIHLPLAALMRPKSLGEFAGQAHLVAEGRLFRKLVESGNIPSMIFWGPPGVGKTSLAQIIAKTAEAGFAAFSAVSASIKDVRDVMKKAEARQMWGERAIVFVDEIHRFNKGQQDAFLPFVENGSVTLIGATTENPSFEVNSALLSRCKVFLLHGLSADDIEELLRRAVSVFGAETGTEIKIEEKLLRAVAQFANGDARTALNTLEMALSSAERADGIVAVTEELVAQCLAKKISMYDKNGEEHYNQISALHKSMRNSDPHASVYWLARMLEGGEDPLYIARRIIRFAAEDVGLADSNALLLANAAFQASHCIGMPECAVHLAQAAVYCALAPKSNAVYLAYKAAEEDCRRRPNEPVPLAVRNAPAELMRELGYGQGYQYAHDLSGKIADIQCLPDSLKDRKYYAPTAEGREAKLAEHMRRLSELKDRAARDSRQTREPARR